MPSSDKASQSRPERISRLWQIVARCSRRVFQFLEWIGRHEAGVLAVILAIVSAIWGFFAIAHQVVAGATISFDSWAIRAMRRSNDLNKPIGPDWLPEVGRDLTALGGVTVLTLLTLTVVGFLWLRKMFSAMFLVLAATLGGLLVSTFLKNLYDRPRPDEVPHLSMVYTSSFPSGHSMLSAIVYLTLGTLLGRFVTEGRLKAYFLLIALTLTFLVGISRVYMGVHYPTDVLAGWSAGLAWALLCWLVARALQHRGTVEPSIPASSE